MHPLDDRELVARCIAGDGGAWKALTERFAPVLAAHVSRALRRLFGQVDPGERDDILQETWVRLSADDAKVLRDFRWGCALATYLKAIAASLCARRARTARRERRLWGRPVDLDLVLAVSPGDAPVPLEKIVSEEDEKGAEAAIASLSDRERLAVRLHFQDGASPAEIARLLGITHANACMILSRATEKARKNIEKNR